MLSVRRRVREVREGRDPLVVLVEAHVDGRRVGRVTNDEAALAGLHHRDVVLEHAQLDAGHLLQVRDDAVVLVGGDGRRTAENRVVVQGVNVVSKHQKPSQFSAGGITKKELPIHASNVALVDPQSGKATRAGYKVDKDGNKTRIARSSGEAV